MSDFNPFLILPTVDPSKGGGRYIEDPKAVENIVFQTRAGALTDFEDRFADQLMAVFADGHEELDAVASALNAAGSADAQGAAWTTQSLCATLAMLGGALFATVEEEVTHG
ncbi:recombinase-like helix-turn-helix domain-containing protein [Sphingobium sp.]|uniref:recombinase-like helix-turn-helix domain-containing protein n=1 Tax=Sphingobium sp. TaxID=1912891 RepID=UPI0035C6E35E